MVYSCCQTELTENILQTFTLQIAASDQNIITVHTRVRIQQATIKWCQTRLQKLHWKNKWSIDSWHPKQNRHKEFSVNSHSHIHSLVVKAFLQTSHYMKACRGIANENHTTCHQGTSGTLVLNIYIYIRWLKVFGVAKEPQPLR